MLSRLAKSLAVKASISRTARPVARYGKYLGKKISIFWKKPRIDVPRSVEAKQRTGCYEAEDPEFTCLYGKPTMGEWLCVAITGGCFLLAVGTSGRSCDKYSFLKTAKQEWDTKSEHEKRISTAEINGNSLCLSEAQDHERMDGVDSMDSGKWAWILQRATEMEQESKGRGH
jgi:hypothetical protein